MDYFYGWAKLMCPRLINHQSRSGRRAQNDQVTSQRVLLQFPLAKSRVKFSILINDSFHASAYKSR